MAEHLISRADAANDILACSAFLAEDIKSNEGQSEAMAAIIPSYLAKGNVDIAAELANAVDDPFMRDRLLILVAQKCAEIDDDEYALQLAKTVEDYGLQSQAREKIALIKAAQGKFEKAREISNVLDHPDSVYSAIAVRQTADGDESSAAQTLAGITFLGALVAAYSQMAVTKLESDDQVRAAEFLEQAVAANDDSEHEEEKIRTLCEIGNLFVEVKQNGRAIEIFDKARTLAESLDNIHRNQFLAAVATGFLQAGSVELADRTLDSITDKTQISTCLLSFARDSWRKGDREDAFEALEESYAILRSQHEKETLDSKAKFKLFSAIAAQFAGFEKGERAIEIAQEIPDENEEMTALAQIARILTVQLHNDLARQAVRAIRDDAARVNALIGMSDAKHDNGANTAAVADLNEASALAETVPQLASRSLAYNEIAKRLDRLGETPNALAMLRTSLGIIAIIRDESSRAVALADLGRVYEELNIEITEIEKEHLSVLIRQSGS